VNGLLKVLLILVGVVLLFPGACAIMLLPQLLSGTYHGGVSDILIWLAMASLGALGVWLINKISRS
jgi:hypothetical protein